MMTQERNIRSTRVRMENVLSELHRLHKAAMADLTEGHEGDWNNYPHAVALNSRIYIAIEHLESALRIVEKIDKPSVP